MSDNLWCVLHLLIPQYQEPAITVMNGQALCGECFEREALAAADAPVSLVAMVDRAREAWKNRRELR